MFAVLLASDWGAVFAGLWLPVSYALGMMLASAELAEWPDCSCGAFYVVFVLLSPLAVPLFFLTEMALFIGHLLVDYWYFKE